MRDSAYMRFQNLLRLWLTRVLIALWALAVGIVWVFAAIFVGGYLLVRRIVRRGEKWPTDD